MTDKLKTLLLAISAALVAMGVALTVYVSTSEDPAPQVSPSPAPSVLPSPIASVSPSPIPSPTPAASPSPKPSVVPSPTPTISPTPSASPSASPVVSIKLLTGMVEGFEFVATTTTLPPAPVGLSYQLLSITDVETTIPTYKGARVGKYGDKLDAASSIVVGNKYWIDIKGITAGTYYPVVNGQQVQVQVLPKAFAFPAPIYMEMQFAAISTANGLIDDGSTWVKRIALNKQYADILRAHGIEPIKQWAYVYPDVTNADFKSIVTTGNIAPPCLFGPSPSIPPTAAQLQAYEAAIKSGALPVGTWAYAWDEGEGDAADTAAALARVKLIKQYAPSLKVMITRQFDSQFIPYVDIFTPIINWYNQPGFVPASSYSSNVNVWLYHSCMSANRCNNATSEAAVDQLPSKFPMHAIDAPDTDPERFVTESLAAGAKAMLYYNTTESITTATKVGGQYKFGNNGDGNDLYPALGYSKKLKYYRRGLNKEALKRAGF